MKNQFIERNSYSSHELTDVFDTSEIRQLLGLKILESKNGKYIFTYVGVISARKQPIFIYPKIFNSLELNNNCLKKNIQAIELYPKSNNRLQEGVDFFELNNDSPEFSEFSIAKFLIEDYERNGLLVFREELFEINGSSYTDWSQTVSQLDPIFSNHRPIYFETINNVVQEDTENILIDIHRFCVSEASKKYCTFLGKDDIPSFVGQNDLDYDLEFILESVKKQLRVTFTDREIMVMKAMISFLSRKFSFEDDSITLYGTRNYELIWEHICQYVLCDQYSSIKSEYNIFPNPIWELDGIPFNSSSDLRPDLVVMEKKTGYLFDAKYYQLSINGTKISGEPGFKDILKQFLYQKHLEEELVKKHRKVSVINNTFLFPINQIEFESLRQIHPSNDYIIKMGVVTYPLFQNKRIDVLFCNFERFRDLYVRRKRISCELLLNLND